MADNSCSDSDLDRHAGGKNVKDDQELLKAGSTALLNNCPQDAVSNYKSYLEKIPIKLSQKISIAQVVLRYSFCIALIKCNDYQNIADAAEYLMELIDSGYASKFPALYLALAKAYYSLNRFQKALEIIEKALKLVPNISKVKHQSWPGLQLTIQESGKDILLKELLSLQKECENFKPPDAVCGYDKCLEYSTHIVPAREIRFTDPDFKPFLLLKCTAKCQFAYHNSCWEHLKHLNMHLEEPKDLLDMPCSSDKCSPDKDNNSVILEVQSIGSEGFKKPLIICNRNKSSDNSSNSSTDTHSRSAPKSCVRMPSSPAYSGWQSNNISSARIAQGVPLVVQSRFAPATIPRPYAQPAPAPYYFRAGPPCYYPPCPPFQVPQQPLMPPHYHLVGHPPQPQRNFVEVYVHRTSMLSQGSTLYVPIAPGPVQVGPPSLQSPGTAKVTELAKETPKSSNKLHSVVEDFKKVVRELAGCSETSPNTSPDTSFSTPNTSKEVPIKDVVENFKKLVHGSVTEKPAAFNKKTLVEDVGDENHNTIPLTHTSVPNFWPKLCTAEKPMSTQDHLDLNLKNPSATLQAKSKSYFKDDQSSQEKPLILSPSIINLFCSSEEDLASEPFKSSSPKSDTILEILNRCRSMKFGYSDDEYMNPELQCFGHPFAEFSSYVGPNEIDDDYVQQADFVFSYYQSVFDKNGHDRIEDLQDKWKTTINNDLGLSETFTDKYSSVSEFLLKSKKFAAIDDIIGTSDLLPDMFSNAETEITQSVSYLLSSRKVSNTQNEEKTLSNESCNDTWKMKINNNNCDTNSQLSSSLSNYADCSSNPSREDSDVCYKSESDVSISDRDSNHNPISVRKKASHVNGEHKPSSIFVPEDPNISKSDDLYMSDDDEEIDTSLVDVHEDGSAIKGESYENSSILPQKWSEGINKADTVDRDSQTENISDPEKNSLMKENQSLKKQLLGLAYEKDELQRRIESLQMQMENIQASQESEHAKAILQAQKEAEALACKDKELKEMENKYCSLEQESKRYQEIVVEHEKKIADLEAMMDQTRRRHAKEINNFEKRLQVEKQHKEQEFQNLLKGKDQQYIQLWKDFCDFKFKKFNQGCNDKINLLSQLKDMMSESSRPTKSEIKSSIDKIEDDMITVSLKINDVNCVYNQQMENLKNGVDIQVPPVVDVPDIVNTPFEGAFEYIHSLLKTKQDELTMPRSYGPSKFYPSFYPSNGFQSLSQTREAEVFSPMTSASLFGPTQNETSNLWNNTYPNPTTHTAMPFDSNAAHINLPTVGASSMITPQPQLSNLMPQMMPYQQSTSNQNPAVQSRLSQSRSTPSPQSYPSMNGSVYNGPAIGSKPSSLGSLQKPVSAPTPPTSSVKSPTPVLSGATLGAAQQTQASSAQLGAIPRPRVQTATASMTPIVPTKPRPTIKSSKGESNYEKLMRSLQRMFPNRNDGELTQALRMARYRNGNTLSSLTHSEIVAKVQDVLNKQSKQTSMGWEKFGQAAWGTAKATVPEWEGGDQDECVICMNPMSAKEIYSLECKHSFHKECIRKWLLQDSICPNCRTHSTMTDEFPPLA
ncbi:E3 ubiquitin-protein ligase TTC3 [Frankliniella fusca]|uniref:E3 ubiquitin-protein ligase TTC3 n=1 Tax=Frankliniella fusca TaxID=407009 RepID=A0AAE1LKG2_9NEOP|nr:E3 ubiquitin-protein ligase TTC3 [Frankliniella fusca]